MDVAGRPRLRPSEWRVLARLARGEDNVAIAAALGLAPDTVKGHVTRIYQQLPLPGVHTKRAEAASWYLREGHKYHEEAY